MVAEVKELFGNIGRNIEQSYDHLNTSLNQLYLSFADRVKLLYSYAQFKEDTSKHGRGQGGNFSKAADNCPHISQIKSSIYEGVVNQMRDTASPGADNTIFERLRVTAIRPVGNDSGMSPVEIVENNISKKVQKPVWKRVNKAVNDIEKIVYKAEAAAATEAAAAAAAAAVEAEAEAEVSGKLSLRSRTMLMVGVLERSARWFIKSITFLT